MLSLPGGRGGRLFEVWSRRKWLAVVVFAIAAVAGLTAAISVPDVYEATATVLVEEVDSAAAGRLDRRLQVITQEILSRSRLENLVHSYGLYPHLQGRASSEALVGRMRRDVRTEFQAPPVAGGPSATLAFTITYRAARPDAAARVANALAAFYLEEDVRIRDKKAGEAVQVLKGQLDEMGRKLAEQRQQLGGDAGGGGDLPQQTAVDLAAVSRVHADLRSRTDERLRAQDRRNDLLRRLAEAESGGPAGPMEAPTRLARLKGELADLQRRFSDRYPDVVRLQDEIATLEAQEVGTKPVAAPATAPQSTAVIRVRESLAEVDADIRRLRSDEDGLRGEIAAYTHRLDGAPGRQRAMEETSRDYQAGRDTYDSLRRRYEQARLEEAADGTIAEPRFRILDAAVLPTFPAAPNRMMLLGLALGAALALSVGAVVIRERLDTSFHSVDDLAAFTRVRVLASIPRIVTPKDLHARRVRFCLAAVAVTIGLALVAQTSRILSRAEDGLVATLSRGRS